MYYKDAVWRSHDILPLDETLGFQRVLVTGSRTWPRPGLVIDSLGYYWELGGFMTVVHGDCPKGPDRVARDYCRRMNDGAVEAIGGPALQEEPHPAKWRLNDVFNRHAGFERNEHMVNLGATVCLAFIDVCKDKKCKQLSLHGSHGTEHCAHLAKAKGITTVRFQTWLRE